MVCFLGLLLASYNMFPPPMSHKPKQYINHVKLPRPPSPNRRSLENYPRPAVRWVCRVHYTRSSFFWRLSVSIHHCWSNSSSLCMTMKNSPGLIKGILIYHKLQQSLKDSQRKEKCWHSREENMFSSTLWTNDFYIRWGSEDVDLGAVQWRHVTFF